jgi:hypothetical protein
MTTQQVRPSVPGAETVAAAVTAVMTAPLPRRPDGLVQARMTDLDGMLLYVGWIPVGAQVVARGARVFMHFQGREWRQVPVVTLGENGRPL